MAGAGTAELAMSKLYFFNGGQYSRYDVKQDAVDPAYPLPVAVNWPGLPASGVDAAVNWGNGHVCQLGPHHPAERASHKRA